MSLKIERLQVCPPKKSVEVKVTEMGNIVEVQYMSRRNTKATIQMLPGGEKYVALSTGEVKDVIHHNTRAEQIKNLCRTFANARALINTNVTDVNRVRWLTLTYAENMTDTIQLYNDFRKFNQRFQTYCSNQDYGNPEYIAMMEPQGRGAWHVHMLYIFDLVKAPYIANKTLNGIWGHGFVKIKKLDAVDNVGAYLTAYLGDMELTEATKELGLGFLQESEIKEVEIEENGKRSKKYFVKGARLHMYPAKFNMIRCSRGINRPIPEMMFLTEAEKKVSSAKLTYEKTVMLQDLENDFETIINTRYYNKQRTQIQDN